MNEEQLLNEYFGSLTEDDGKDEGASDEYDGHFGYPLGTMVRCGSSWSRSQSFAFVGEADIDGETCPVLMKKEALKHSMSPNPDLYVAEPETELKWVSDADPPRAYSKRLKDFVERLRDRGDLTTDRKFPSEERIAQSFKPAPAKSTQVLDPGDLCMVNGDKYLYCGKHKDKWIMAAEDDSNGGASLSIEDVKGEEYTVDIVEKQDVEVLRSRWRPDVAHEIHKRTINEPRFGRPVKVNYSDYDDDTIGRWIGNYKKYSSIVAVRPGDRNDPDDRMDVKSVLNHPDDNEQYEMLNVSDDRIKLQNDMPNPEVVQYLRKMVKIPPNLRDQYAGKFKRAYLQGR